MIKRGFIVILLLALLLAGCSAAATQMPDSNRGSEAPGEPAAAPSLDKGGADPTGEYTSGSGGNAAVTERLIIKNADLAIAVVDPLQTMNFISGLADQMGGFVVSSNTYKSQLASGTDVTEARITVRVPAERLNEALEQIEAQVRNRETDILSRNVSGEDVTREYTDLKSRLRNLEQAEEQLREIMASATKPEDVLNVFNQLTYVREQIEVLKGQIQYFEEAARLSAINVHIRAEASVQPLSIGGWKPAGIARAAVQTLIDTMQLLAGVVIWLILYILPVFVVIFIPLRLLWLAFRKWRSNRPGPPRPVAPPAPPAGG